MGDYDSDESIDPKICEELDNEEEHFSGLFPDPLEDVTFKLKALFFSRENISRLYKPMLLFENATGETYITLFVFMDKRFREQFAELYETKLYKKYLRNQYLTKSPPLHKLIINLHPEELPKLKAHIKKYLILAHEHQCLGARDGIRDEGLNGAITRTKEEREKRRERRKKMRLERRMNRKRRHDSTVKVADKPFNFWRESRRLNKFEFATYFPQYDTDECEND